MLYKKMTQLLAKEIKKAITKVILLLVISLCISSCRGPQNFGFYQPLTLSLVVPDGPPEYKSGWYHGCKSGIGNGVYLNGIVHRDDGTQQQGSGIYQHDPKFVTGWGQGWFACIIHTGTFTNMSSMNYAPLN